MYVQFKEEDDECVCVGTCNNRCIEGWILLLLILTILRLRMNIFLNQIKSLHLYTQKR